MFAVLVFAAIIVSVDVAAPPRFAFTAGAVVIAVFVQLWLSTVAVNGTEIASLVIAAVLMASALGLVVEAHLAKTDAALP